MGLRANGVLTATLAAAALLGLAIREDWRAVQMVAGLATLALVAILAFVMFLSSLFGEPGATGHGSASPHHGRSLW